MSTAQRAIEMALYDAGLIQQGQVPTTDQYTDGLNRLNDMVNLWQTQGLKLWLQADLSIPLVAGQATYNIGPAGHVVMTKPTRILDSCYYLDTHNNRRPVSLMSRDEYMKLSNVVQQGSITSIFVDKQATQLAVSCWLVPSATEALGTLHVLIQNKASNFTLITQEVGFPDEWFIALRWGLADELATGQPQAIMDRCQARANAYRSALEDWDVEDTSTRFAPDSQAMPVSRFR